MYSCSSNQRQLNEIFNSSFPVDKLIVMTKEKIDSPRVRFLYVLQVARNDLKFSKMLKPILY